ncbi:YjbQ family protein [Thioalkalivibrio sp. XN8]|nr:YjbQ family protein [Thioalkalivibrio sp. XN8]
MASGSRTGRGAMYQASYEIATRGRGLLELTGQVTEAAREAAVSTGIAHVFVHHTSASLLITENADPAVHRDLERVLARLAPDGDPEFEHDAEGPDDMPAHVRSMLTGCSLSVPVTGGRLALGTWQGIYLYEHRHAPHRRRITVTVQGA